MPYRFFSSAVGAPESGKVFSIQPPILYKPWRRLGRNIGPCRVGVHVLWTGTSRLRPHVYPSALHGFFQRWGCARHLVAREACPSRGGSVSRKYADATRTYATSLVKKEQNHTIASYESRQNNIHPHCAPRNGVRILINCGTPGRGNSR